MSDKSRFNEYCARIMGYEIDEQFAGLYIKQKKPLGSFYYDPYDDLNKMTEAVEKLIDKHFALIEWPVLDTFQRQGIKLAFRDFIISTMDKS